MGRGIHFSKHIPVVSFRLGWTGWLVLLLALGLVGAGRPMAPPPSAPAAMVHGPVAHGPVADGAAPAWVASVARTTRSERHAEVGHARQGLHDGANCAASHCDVAACCAPGAAWPPTLAGVPEPVASRAPAQAESPWPGGRSVPPEQPPPIG